jgi:death-on-curing protein
MRTISLSEALVLYRRIMAQSAGLAGIRDLGALQSALVQAEMTFDGQELYPTLVDKAAAIGFSLIRNHPFLDGNKWMGHAVMETLLLLKAGRSTHLRTSRRQPSGGLPRASGDGPN